MTIADLGPYTIYIVLGLVGLIAGGICGALLGGGGLIRNLVVGVLGAFVGSYLVQIGLLKLPFNIPFQFGQEVAVATVGALIVTVAARLLAGRR
jgi:uncharacterized membrane protein YeaQ/YmgE (transglycosylase-associated protein family)